jgi:hypothetical protein
LSHPSSIKLLELPKHPENSLDFGISTLIPDQVDK